MKAAFGFAEEIPVLNLVCVSWSYELGGYILQCKMQEDPRDTFTLWVEENGRELERHVVETNGPEEWRKPFDLADALYRKYYPTFIAHIRSQRR
jgi:hypothetical protein